MYTHRSVELVFASIDGLSGCYYEREMLQNWKDSLVKLLPCAIVWSNLETIFMHFDVYIQQYVILLLDNGDHEECEDCVMLLHCYLDTADAMSKQWRGTLYSKDVFPNMWKPGSGGTASFTFNHLMSTSAHCWPHRLPKHTLTFPFPLAARSLPGNAKAISQLWTTNRGWSEPY